MKRIVISLLFALCIARSQASDEEMSGSFFHNRENLTVQLIEESKCLEKEGLTMDDVKPFALEDKLELAESNPKLKCFAACLFEHSGIMSNCKLTIDKFAGSDMKDLHDALVPCKGAEDGGSRCQCAYDLAKCMLDLEESEEGDN